MGGDEIPSAQNRRKVYVLHTQVGDPLDIFTWRLNISTFCIYPTSSKPCTPSFRRIVSIDALSVQMASVLAQRSSVCLTGLSRRAVGCAARPNARLSRQVAVSSTAPRTFGARSFRCSSQLLQEVRPESPAESPGGRAPQIVRGASKVFKSADEAVADVQSGSVILSAGFGLCGVAGAVFKSDTRDEDRSNSALQTLLLRP